MLGPWVQQFRQVHKDPCHLVSPLSTADIDYDVRIRPLGKLVLGNGFSGPEASWYACSTTPRQGEEGVYYPLPGNKGLRGYQPFPVWADLSYRPSVEQLEFMNFIRRGPDYCDDVIKGIVPFGHDMFQSPLHPGRNHNPMCNEV